LLPFTETGSKRRRWTTVVVAVVIVVVVLAGCGLLLWKCRRRIKGEKLFVSETILNLAYYGV